MVGGDSAAIYLARANLKPVLFEGFMALGVAAGGQLTTTTDVSFFFFFFPLSSSLGKVQGLEAQGFDEGTLESAMGEDDTKMECDERENRRATLEGNTVRALLLTIGASALRSNRFPRSRMGCQARL